MTTAKIAILGDGLLGSELHKQTGWPMFSRKKDGIDITDPLSYQTMLRRYNVIINCMAYTNTYDKSPDKHWEVNYGGVANLLQWCNYTDKKLVHISTDYLYSGSVADAKETDVPVHCRNWYGYTKLLADGFVRLMGREYLLIRCTHKAEPFPHEKAFNQIGNFDYVSKIASLIVRLVVKDAIGTFNVGTEKKTMQELAERTKPGIKVTYENIPDTMPTNTTMSIEKMTNFFKKYE